MFLESFCIFKTFKISMSIGFFFFNFFPPIKHAPFVFTIKREIGIEIGENIVYDPFMHIWFKCV